MSPANNRLCCIVISTQRNASDQRIVKKRQKVSYLYSIFIVIPRTQGTQVRITQCYLQITPHLPLHTKGMVGSIIWVLLEI